MCAKTHKPWNVGLLVWGVITCLTIPAVAQFSSGSDGSDGVFSPTADVIINMGDHPDGIYQYVSVNIPAGVTVTFVPNILNTSVTWLVQGDCTVNGTIDISGGDADGVRVGLGGPGGFSGGSAEAFGAGDGKGPGGGGGGSSPNYWSTGGHADRGFNSYYQGRPYGTRTLLPLIGGSGGGGGYIQESGQGETEYRPGPGGGGAILIAATGTIAGSGVIDASGGSGGAEEPVKVFSLASGGGIRLVSSQFAFSGLLDAGGGRTSTSTRGGHGRIRIESPLLSNSYEVRGVLSTSRVYNILMLPQGAAPSLRISAVGGQAIGSPSGIPDAPDVLIPSNQTTLDVQVATSNIEPGTIVELVVQPELQSSYRYPAPVTGSYEDGTATISLSIYEGSGTMFALATIGLLENTKSETPTNLSLSQTGLAPNGERFSTARIVSAPGGEPHLEYVTESGAVYSHPGAVSE